MTPELAVRYLRELSADLVVAAVAGAAGEPLAGPADLATAGLGLFDEVPDAAPYATLEVRAGGAVVVVARSPEHAIVAVHGPHALAGLVRHDVVTVLADLASTPGPPPEVVRAHDVAVTSALAEALRRLRQRPDPAA